MKKFFVFLSVFLFISGCDYLEVDKCLDRGGRWNYEKKVCELEENANGRTEK